MKIEPLSYCKLVSVLVYIHADALVCARPSQSSFSKTVRVVEDLRNGVINFECRRSKQRLIGPQNKTCNESTGDWVPEKNPICGTLSNSRDFPSHE